MSVVSRTCPDVPQRHHDFGLVKQRNKGASQKVTRQGKKRRRRVNNSYGVDWNHKSCTVPAT